MGRTKESVIRILEQAKADCCQAVLDGTMTLEEYTQHTKMDSADLEQQIITAAKLDFHLSCVALRQAAMDAETKAAAKLIAAGLGEDVIRGIIGAPAQDNGEITEPDWERIIAEAGADRKVPEDDPVTGLTEAEG